MIRSPLMSMDPNGLLGDVAKVLGAGTGGAILLKVIEKVFARADKNDDVAKGLRGEMVRRLETLEKHVRTLQEDRDREYRARVQLEAENRALRQRYHGLINWLSDQPQLPTLPRWMREQVAGPTEDQADPEDDDGEQPTPTPQRRRSAAKGSGDPGSIPLQESDSPEDPLLRPGNSGC